ALGATAGAAGGGSRRRRGAPRGVMGPVAARRLAAMMVGTTRAGTARGAFHDGAGRLLLPFDVAGKTGTLTRHEPYLAYSWFVGFAPAHNPQVAFAVLVGNHEDWTVRAPQLARKLLEAQADSAFIASR